MNVKHCRGCIFFADAGHPKASPLAKKYNNWCCHYGCAAVHAIGRCKLKNGKKLSQEAT